MSDIVEKYGFEIGRNNRIACPFHNGKDKNLAYKGTMFNCFVCHEKGDLISFVEKYFNLGFRETVEKLNKDFNLGFPIDRKGGGSPERISVEPEHTERTPPEQAEEETDEERLIRKYLEADSVVNNLKADIEQYAPKNPDLFDSVDDRFVYALKHLAGAEDDLEKAENALACFWHTEMLKYRWHYKFSKDDSCNQKKHGSKRQKRTVSEGERG